MAEAARLDSRFRLTESAARGLAERFGTPLYVVDEAHLRERIRQYQDAFRTAYPRCELSYASKANSAAALLQIAYQEGCVIDVASEGELRAALLAGVPASRCHLHGNNKLPNEIDFALEVGIGAIVVDHSGELEQLGRSGVPEGTSLVLRLAPGVDPVTHAKISTGQADTKFGFNIADGSAEAAVLTCVRYGLPLIGYHCHVGSQLIDPGAQQAGGIAIAEFGVAMLSKHHVPLRYLNVGGGLGVRYTNADAPMSVEEYNRLVGVAIVQSLAALPELPLLGQEPGRALIAESGVTLYEVGVIKEVPTPSQGRRTYVTVDGGLSDNPRPALYGSRYTVERAWPEREVEFTKVRVSGRHCETDLLFDDLDLPSDLERGHLLQVLCTGAYNASMASNYNRFLRPAMVLLRQNGTVSVIQRRETWNDLLARDVIPEDLQPC